MRRFLALGLCIIAAAGWFFLNSDSQSDITLTDARAYPINPDGGMFMVTLNITNNGSPVELRGVSSPKAQNVFVINPGFKDAPLMVPGNSSVSLEMDGAHIMMHASDFPMGGLIPIALEFDDTTVTTQVLHIDPAGQPAMHHGVQHGIEIKPSPRVTLRLPETLDQSGFTALLEFQDFSVVKTPDGAAHVAGEGHAHVYLNGLKLGRAYETRFDIGALKPGKYTLTASLNAHDHRPYVTNGAPVQSVVDFIIP